MQSNSTSPPSRAESASAFVNCGSFLEGGKLGVEGPRAEGVGLGVSGFGGCRHLDKPSGVFETSEPGADRPRSQA